MAKCGEKIYIKYFPSGKPAIYARIRKGKDGKFTIETAAAFCSDLIWDKNTSFPNFDTRHDARKYMEEYVNGHDGWSLD